MNRYGCVPLLDKLMSNKTQVSTRDEDDHVEGRPPIPSSPPPPFQSRPTSPTERDRFIGYHDPLGNVNDGDVERTLAETFDDGSDSEDGDGRDGGDESTRRLVSGNSTGARSGSGNEVGSPVERRVTQYPAFATTTTRVYGTGQTNDGVFSNLAAKPSRGGEEADEKPPVRPLIMHLVSSNSCSHMNKQQQTLHHHIGKQQSSPPACSLMKSTSMVSLLALYFPLSGMP
jgi:hypothetical protein